MKKLVLKIVILLLVTASIAGWYFSGDDSKKGGFATEKVTKGNIRVVISASGSLAALTTVEIGSQISGNILKLTADFNDNVKEGQLLAQLDPSTYEAQVMQAKANLENAAASEKTIEAQIKNLQASLLNAKSEIEVSKANVRKAEVSLKEAERNYKRFKELHERKLVSRSDLDQAETTYEAQKANLEAAKAQSRSAEARELSILAQIEAEKAQLQGAVAKVKQMEAQLNIAQINLDRTKIYSPIDGVVISRLVDVGQTVAASLQAPRLFIIAQDLREMQIDTAVDEADIGQVKEGQPVTFTVDAYRNKTFKGIISQVRLSPVENSNVVTYSVMVSVKNDDLLLKPGMTANVEIIAVDKKDVLRIPTKALYFKPNGKLAEKMKKIADTLATDSIPVWVLDKKPELKVVKMGISNNDYIEVLSDEIKEGDLIITGMTGNLNDDNKRNGVLNVRSVRRATRRM